MMTSITTRPKEVKGKKRRYDSITGTRLFCAWVLCTIPTEAEHKKPSHENGWKTNCQLSAALAQAAGEAKRPLSDNRGEWEKAAAVEFRVQTVARTKHDATQKLAYKVVSGYLNNKAQDLLTKHLQTNDDRALETTRTTSVAEGHIDEFFKKIAAVNSNIDGFLAVGDGTSNIKKSLADITAAEKTFKIEKSAANQNNTRGSHQ
uniref:Variant surface glycoprotein n=1 Tax=Trypanosoma brucei TaxID=5691 RepID=A0A1V0FYM2_9TRYP|nr:variant surface glycoprotein [Trypanosoma brucei]